MLTLQNILDSDTISTLVAKVNANFQSIALSNGGPQGVRGEQGIPGLPGRQGPTGPFGPVGATGPATGIIPFSKSTTTTNIGGIPQPDASYNFLTTSSDWSPQSPLSNQVWFDNNQLGWWKFLEIPDPATDDPDIGGDIDTGPYSSGPGFTGPGWYFYPLNFESLTNSLSSPWIKDSTNYLGRITGSAYGSPSAVPDITTGAPFGIPNARMTSKFGTVFITSFDKQGTFTGPGSTGPTSNDTSLLYSLSYSTIPRINSGVDRTLFKMSIDGVRYYDNMKARGYRITDTGPIIGIPYEVDGGLITIPVTGPSVPAIGANATYYVQPLYDISIDAYAPLLYLTNRNDTIEGNPQDNGSLGYYQYSSVLGDGTMQIHNFSTRYANEFFDASELTASTNTGEMLFDVRRFITTNQYLNMFPQDTTGYTSLVGGTGPKSPYSPSSIINIKEWGSPTQFAAYQGYHSVFTGQKIVAGAVGPSNQSEIADTLTWMYNNRQSWYGTSIFEEAPDPQSGGNTEMVRSAGLMVRGHNASYNSTPGFVDGVIVYTSNMTGTGPNAYDNDDTISKLLSLPVAYFSPSRNFGVGTITMDKVGVFEPSARFQSHADWRPELESFNTTTNYTAALSSGPYSGINKSWLTYTSYPVLRRMKSAAFTIERASPALIYGTGATGPFWPTSRFQTGPAYFADWTGRGVFNDIQIGAIDTPYHEPSALGVLPSAKPTAGLRYESFNFIYPNTGIPIDHGSASKSHGFGWRGALRLGTTPRYTPLSGLFDRPDNVEIGDDANFQAVDYQISLSPLSSSAQAGPDIIKEAITGVGIHNLYPRARLHMFGKNIYQEFRFDEAASPGYVQPLLQYDSAVTPSTWKALPSNKQIAIDQILDTYVYNAGIFDYPYDFTVTPSIYTGSAILWSANAKNYPTKEWTASNPSNSFTFNTSSPLGNRSELGIARVGGPDLGAAAAHGGLWNAYWNVDKYIGFNLFRDLLAKGDAKGSTIGNSAYINWDTNSYLNDQFASVWRAGTEGVGKDPSGPADNGGSAIFSDTDGRLGFAFIPKWRDGGQNYGQWEQQGIGTREVVNNIKIVFDSYGNIGIGNAPGYDENAYPSTYWNANGAINYLPNSFSFGGDPEIDPPISYIEDATVPFTGLMNVNAKYGLASNAYSGDNTARVNAQATVSDIIRMEIGAEKAHSRPGHTPDKRGYGYPGWFLTAEGVPGVLTDANLGATVTITDDTDNQFANRYLGVPHSTAGWGSAVHIFRFDSLGRMISYRIDGIPSATPEGPISSATITRPALPHPREFGPGGPFSQVGYPNTAAYAWLDGGIACTISINGTPVASNKLIWIPVSAVAAEIQSLNCIVPEEGNKYAQAAFAYESLQPANMRLNNFTLGEGYELIRSSGNAFDQSLVVDTSVTTTRAIYESRTSSPKLLMTFGAPDNLTMDFVGLSTTNKNRLITAGTAPLMKVTTAIESAQTEAALRTYTIPKADNTGGTFLVITDHMGVKGTVEPGMQPLPDPAHQADPNVSSKFRIERISAYEVLRTAPSVALVEGELYGFDPANPPENFSYEMSLINYWNNGYEPHLRGISELYYPSSGLPGQNFAVETDRDVDSYWRMNFDPYASRWNEQNGSNVTATKSEVRYRRLNSDFLLFDFNISLDALDYMQMAENPVIIPLVNIIGSDGVGFNLQNYVHSPWAAGYFSDELRGIDEDRAAASTWIGIDARWIQYVRIAYDIGENVTFGDNPTLRDDPNYYEYGYGGGANFGNWNDYRPWYPGTAVVGPDFVTNDDNWVDNTGFLQGWVPGTDGAPYLRNTPDDQRVAGGPTKHFSKAWNGDFPDWYYGLWNQGMFHGSETAQTSPNPFFDRPDLFWSNPWYKIKDTSPLRTAANAYDGWFKRSNLAAMGYTKLYRGWYQSLASPAGVGATGYVSAGGPSYPWSSSDAYLVVNIPQYFDAAVWRSFGQDAWKRNAGFQWRVTPYYNNPDNPGTPPPAGVFNTFVIEIMFDKPIHVSGANRRFCGDIDINTDLLENGLVASDGASYLQKWSQNSSISTGTTSLENRIPEAAFGGTFPVYQRSLEQFEFYLGSGADNPRVAGSLMRPYGNIELRGQAMLNYKKLYAPA
jgi:hypothetical protein